MTIFEPAHERFIIIDGSRRKVVVVPFEYLENCLFRRRPRPSGKLKSSAGMGPRTRRQADLLQFRLTPKLTEKYDARKQLLTMNSPFLSYEVECGAHESTEAIQRYLNFADWVQRLNYLLNGRAMPPGPRLELNEALRRRNMLPTEVTLHVRERRRPASARRASLPLDSGPHGPQADHALGEAARAPGT